MANRGAGGRKGKTLSPEVKKARRPGNELRTTKNKKRHIQSIIDKVRFNKKSTRAERRAELQNSR